MDESSRREPPENADEQTTLLGFLRYHRDTLDWKCSGVSDEQLRARPIASTNLSLLGLVRHLAEVERSWILAGVEGNRPHTAIWCRPDNQDADFDDVDTADIAEAFNRWREASAHADEVLSGRNLDDTFAAKQGWTVSIRWLICHLIEEYARHNGHADLIRQAIDGATGE